MAKKCEGVKKGAWTNEEDNLLRKCIDTFGEGKWHQVPLRSGLNRCRQSCRLRWMNYLKPNLKRGYFTKDEVDLILRLHKLLGNRWSLIAGRLPGRTANDVKNFWNTHISKKSAATKQSRSKSKTSRKAINNTNIIRPRPRTLIFPKLDFLSHSNDENLSNIMKPPSTPQSSNPDTMEDENKEFFKEEAIEYSHQNQTCESLLQQEMDHCIQWWSSLLETTKNVQPFSEEGSLSSLELSGPGSGNNAEVDGLRCLPAVDTLMLENL